ncbi:MAG TPA: hypothetical protein VFM25_12760 [Verrucomicrobiae bacterium]|nr:hypothetical protein [Verrucomicrobiae bacterium]
MSINWKWNAPVRGVFRMTAGVLGVLFIAMGALLVFTDHQTPSKQYMQCLDLARSF